MSEQLELIPSRRKPCPFCHSKRSTIKPVWKTKRFVACDDCKAGGPIRDTAEKAEQAWNTRYENMCQMDDLKTSIGNEVYYDHTEHIYWCSSCHEDFSLIRYNDDGETWCELPKYCPSCGAKVVDDEHGSGELVDVCGG